MFHERKTTKKKHLGKVTPGSCVTPNSATRICCCSISCPKLAVSCHLSPDNIALPNYSPTFIGDHTESMKFTLAIHPCTAVCVLMLLAIVGSVAATTEKTEGLTIAEIGERLQVSNFF